jgi:hypothetical protein
MVLRFNEPDQQVAANVYEQGHKASGKKLQENLLDDQKMRKGAKHLNGFRRSFANRQLVVVFGSFPFGKAPYEKTEQTSHQSQTRDKVTV